MGAAFPGMTVSLKTSLSRLNQMEDKARATGGSCTNIACGPGWTLTGRHMTGTI
jgi:hypothetical protein